MSSGFVPSTVACLAAGLLLAPQARAQKPVPEEFGSSEFRADALIGILYDTKQNQARKPMATNNKAYNNLIDEFISKGWDESVLNRYYRASLPLYATQIFIPLMSARNAPIAFGVDHIVKPMFWIIHYKGQVTAPTDGEWRFWGWGEEVCSVAVNGENVLLANWHEIKTPSVGWKSTEPRGQRVANGHLVAGDWIRLKAGEVVDLDVLIGERGGGVFAAFLLIEKKGEVYQQANGHRLFPVFQLAPRKIPTPADSKIAPRFAPSGPIWTAIP